MTFTVTIDGNTRTVQDGSLSIQKAINERTTLVAVVRSLDGSYRPAIGDEITVVQDSVTIFAGTIETTRESKVPGGPTAAIDTEINARDFRGLAERRTLITQRPSETLKARLTWLAGELDGVTLHASQVDGPTLEAKDYDGVRADDILAELSDLTQYTWDINASRVLRMALPSSQTAPIDLDESDPIWLGDIAADPSRSNYANTVMLRAGTDKVVEKSESFTGNGSTSSWTLTYPQVGNRGYVVANGNFETLDTVAGASWLLSGQTLTRNAGNLTNGHVVTIVYDAQFPIYVTAEDATEVSTHGVWDILIEQPSIFDVVEAQAFADAELALRLAWITTITASTFTAGLTPGQQITVDVASRGLTAATGVITEVTTRNNAGTTRLRHDVTVVVGDLWRTWRDDLRGSGRGAASSVLGSGTFVVSQAGLSPDGNLKARQGTDFEVEIGQFPILTTFNGVRAVDPDGYNWYAGVTPTSGSRYQWVLYDTRDGSNKPCVGWYYNATAGAYIFGPPENSPTHSVDFGRNTGSSSDRVRNIWAQQVYGHNGFLERSRTVALGEYASYTPTWAGSGSNPSLGDGTLTGSFTRWGNVVHAELVLVPGSTTTFGSGTYTFTLPVTASAVGNSVRNAGTALIYDSGSGLYYSATVRLASTTTVDLILNDGGASFAPTAPITLAQSDQVGLAITYRAA